MPIFRSALGALMWLLGAMPALAEPAPSMVATPGCTTTILPRTAASPASWRDCAGAPEMIRLRGGPFRMGDLDGTGLSAERPVRQLTVRGFAISKTEVTFEQWDACQADGACPQASDHGWGRGQRPVIGVSWQGAQRYVQWLSARTGKPYRLPSEVEWEYAARAGSVTRYSWGDGAEWVCNHANVLDAQGREAHPKWNWSVVCDDGHPATAPVASYQPNAWGLYDLAGNVWEWTADCWHPDYTGAPLGSAPWLAEQAGDCTRRVNRGGGWGNNPRTMRSSTRDADAVDGSGDALGFRVARSL